MNVEVINPFIQGTKQVLATVCNLDSKMGKVSIKSKPFEDKINISIGIVGDIKGKVNYAFDLNVALFIASKMMFMEVNTLDDISKSAICELSNMISGAIATIFSNNGKVIDITTPKLEENYLNCDVDKFVSIPLELEAGKIFEIGVWIEE
ncbi:chemotaxis protein CheX [[Clostridium] colinum]|uniref:chemotaxis protein CheX n=1 Tax=[Clostridium] colinum TaxID=36835 RepID=UPI002023C991|nr:chemotaxis protein CheX [[Clostridium] colinum]